MSNTIKNFYTRIKGYLSNESLITDIVAKLIITFGVVLIIAGLYLMIVNPVVSTQANVSTQSPVATIEWIPGIPFYIGDLANVNAIVVGSVSWILGVDLLLVGMGLWGRHKIARFAAIIIWNLRFADIYCRVKCQRSSHLFLAFKIRHSKGTAK
jgi:hypothetical protein